MTRFNTFLLPLLAGAALATPADKCAPIKAAVSLLALQSGATKFCSSYLGIKTCTKTSTSTVTPDPTTTTVMTTTTFPTATSTSTSTVVTTTVTISVFTTQSTSTSTTYSTSYTPVTCATAATVLSATTDSPGLKARGVSAQATPACVKGQKPTLISQECSCLNIPTPTTITVKMTTLPKLTVTTTSTVTASPVTTTTVTTTSISTQVSSTTTTLDPATSVSTVVVHQPTPVFNGLNYYTYENAYEFSQPRANIGLDVTQFKNNNYEYTGTVQNPPDFRCSGSIYLYCPLPNSDNYADYNHITAVMQGYFYAPQTGVYTLTTGYSGIFVDNYLGLWSGDKAYNAWDNNNADFISIRAEEDGSDNEPGTFVTTLTAGQLLPITLIFMNGGGGAGFHFEVYTPDGSVYDDTSLFFLPPCDNGNPFTP